MKALRNDEKGFILVLAMLLLLIITVLVLNSVRATTMNEKMAGGYMDRSRAQNRAELAITEAQNLLVRDATVAARCRDGCAVQSLTTVTAAATGVALPSAWTDSGAIVSSDSKAKLLVALLQDTALPAGKTGKCKPYSIMGRGEGNDTRTTVVLQVVAFVCDLDA